jgi:ribosome-associated protein
MTLKNNIILDPNNLRWEFVRSSGPGGQNVNKVATAVQLRFDVGSCDTLSPDAKARLKTIAGKRLNQNDEIVVTAKRHRSQHQNRQDALVRLMLLIQKALEKPRTRKRTRPSPAAKQRRLEAKRRHGEKKSMRRKVRLES